MSRPSRVTGAAWSERDVMRVLNAALRKLPTMMPSGWEPIETAPRSKRVLVGCRGQTIMDIASLRQGADGEWVWITDDNEGRESGYFDEGEPTHWQPLPDPPT